MSRIRLLVRDGNRGSQRMKSSFTVALQTASKLVTPPLMLRNPLSLVSTEMNTLAKNIMTLIGSGHPTLNKMTGYYFETEGKRVRPLIVLLLSRALGQIPLEERDNVKIDYTDFPTNKIDPTTIREKILSGAPVANFSPLKVLHGITPLNPLTQGAVPLPEEVFDKERGILPKQRRLAEIVEMIHTASLLHDDVIDHAFTRRGKPSGNAAFTNKMAVLAGDFLLGRATVSISRLRNPEVVEIMSNSIANLVEGEFMQLHNTDNEDPRSQSQLHSLIQRVLPTPTKKLETQAHDYRVPTIDETTTTHEEKVNNALQYYTHKSYLKTGALISNSCRATAILSGARQPIVENCFQFGRNLGLCFQLVDDLLDFTVSSKELGKPSGEDLKLGIATAPVLLTWRKDPTLGPLIKRQFSEPGDVQRAFHAVKTHNGIEETRQLAEEYRNKALQNLREALPESDSRSALEFLTNAVLTRKK
ncbi:trans-hexaprenyltranstransferase KNAG_0J01180 [Huiozyma naganishii CBS 8797]|uniref:Hexaprenyl pyrophosphate synthase n=1 Tax=Huiozyma naganishii (strain ATCC MYA-139 / BCRC 22969 / CBS 8797 / KCTC 17520 / NBRC 10181 / NCYC 3082 / Yp74L-3) TaxID=1071383 RepID=J7S9M9_HUIN7|nr:hypothetical protein KNAG_0J01180 [Kazachstania naganishii CBS 8797]CCK72199.1 hypothetical protein KNAG_0J01180 [Kazachstania naganishii CBS 8797]